VKLWNIFTSETSIRLIKEFFAQKWDRRNNNATIKKLLMGHSIRYSINTSFTRTIQWTNFKRHMVKSSVILDP